MSDIQSQGEATSQAAEQNVYAKAQLLRSQQYTPQQKDMLGVILQDGRVYTHGQVKHELITFLNEEAR